MKRYFIIDVKEEDIVPLSTKTTEKTKIKIAPNPASQKIILELNQHLNTKNAILKIFNTTGKIVFKKEIKNQENKIEINTSTWPSGLYLATLEAGGQVWMGEGGGAAVEELCSKGK